MIHSTLYSCDICGQPYQGTGTGGVTTWSKVATSKEIGKY